MHYIIELPERPDEMTRDQFLKAVMSAKPAVEGNVVTNEPCEWKRPLKSDNVTLWATEAL